MTSGRGWAVTGIGSLGHTDAAAAVQDVLALDLDLPFWPQLPRLGPQETMVVQAAHATGLLEPLDVRGAAWRFRGATRADPHPFEPHAAGLAAFVEAVAGRRLPHIKGQWTGPATLAAAVVLDGATALRDEPESCDAVLDALHRNVVAQAQLLLQHADRVDLWLDEPLFATVHAPGRFDIGAARAWYRRLAAACGSHVRVGVHDCAAVDAGLFEIGVPVLSIDATAGLGAEARAALGRHLRHGWVAWGVLPTAPHVEVSPRAVVAAMGACTAGLDIDAETLAAHSLVTPACGLAALDAEAGVSRLRSAQTTSASLRALSR
jgi:hypothetical protein